LLNDVAVILDKPLVSASALQWEGQLTTYHYGVDGPCYRCLYPRPPPAAAVTNCNDGGVIGALTGILGSLQALEVILVLLGRPNYAKKLYLFDAAAGSSKIVKLRAKCPDCLACGPRAIIYNRMPIDNSIAFCCDAKFSDKPPEMPLPLLLPSDRLTYQAYCAAYSKHPHTLIDVRPLIQYKITSLPSSISNCLFS
jgi:adenylyltransferase and sulfurtransferase